MENEGILKAGSESQDSDEPAPPGISKADFKQSSITIKPLVSKPATTTVGFKLTPSPKGVENAKKRLRAFSIQKKTPITPVTVTKPLGGGSTTVFIGKLSNVKVTPKPEDVDQKKPPKPPKPGQARKVLQDSYTELQKRTLEEIEDMKRKMELVELGIPLGLICPSATNDKAMPTKAMPPIKTFLDPAKLDEIIREAKKAKSEGREFKFDYQRLLPDYDNPFQRKKDELEKVRIMSEERDRELRKKAEKEREKDRRKSDKYEKDSRRYSSHRKDEKDKRKDDRDKYRDKPKEKTEDRKDEKKDKELTPVAKKKVEKVADKETKETDVNLSDYLVCDSWSLDNDDKSNASPKVDDRIKNIPIPKETKPKEPPIEIKKEKIDSPLPKPAKKMQKLQPVIDSFKFEIDPNDDELLDMFDENSDLEKFATKTRKREDIFDSPIDMKIFDFDQNTKESADALTDDTFLESVINEIKQEDMSEDEGSQDKGLVEYDSPSKESQSPPLDSRLSVTPELDDRMRGLQSSRSDYSDGYRSTESGYKSTESGYKSSASYKSGESKGDNYRMSMEKELEGQLNKSTVDSLETWSFVLKICQPLLFRHDRNKCYRETRTSPKIWYTENPKLCSCVKDRAIVYDELETCKMNLVDRVYGCDQIPEVELPKSRTWYPRFAHCLTESNAIPSLVPSCDWEADDSQTETPNVRDKRRSSTPQRSEEIYLDREYQRKSPCRFMQAVWPEVSESKAGTPRSTTPVRQESRKKKAEDKDSEYKKKSKKIKLSSEGWSQESDVEEEEKSKKMKAEKLKVRKRKHSTSSVSENDDSAKKRKKALKKAKENKKTKAKLAKRRRISKKYLKKLKEKQKKKKKLASDDEDMEKENRKKEKKLRKKKQQKKKKASKKKKAKDKSSSSSSSSSTSSSSSSETDSEAERRRKKKKNAEVKKKKRKQSTSSSQSEELFDVNILNNIKTERLTDEEKNQQLVEFSPRRQKPREIINVKELQNDFVGNNIHIKQEVEECVSKEGVKMAEFELEEKEFATERVEEIPEVRQVPEAVEQEFEESKQREEIREVSFKEIPLPELSRPDTDTEQISVHKPENTTLPTQVDKASIEPSTPNEQAHTNKTDIPPSPTIDKEPQEINIPLPQVPEESNLSQCSSQESSASKDVPYEKDDSHLRPSSQNSNYSFGDVISASQSYQKDEEKFQSYQKDEEKFQEYEGNYEMYEQLAMAYQSDVAKQAVVPSAAGALDPQRIETVVRARSRGEIKCDWRAADHRAKPAPPPTQRPSRWGLKPGEVNIVLTGGDEYPGRTAEPVYQIQTIANRSENNTAGYDEAYEDMYGASDRLQYGDCFNTEIEPETAAEPHQTTHSSLDDRIDLALRTTVLGEVSKEADEVDGDKDGPEKGILVNKAVPESRGAKRVSFADGYKPGQDSDVEEPPVKKKKKPRRFGCAWPCPASHADHVPLWDALPPPPPPPGSPPPNIHLAIKAQMMMMQQAPQMMQTNPNLMQQPANMMQQPANMIQQAPNMMQQAPNMMQQPPNMMQQAPNMMQQPPMLPQQQLLQQGVKSMMPNAPFTMPQKLEPSVSLPNFLPPEPPPGLLTFP
ncbi:titin homolog isoform X2 [Helicoverpa armigera]|uniref:titin homolog isoform X2 n=1 Tax=Helicoverpa armigera TaxID=29058 RepID=UPI0030838B71